MCHGLKPWSSLWVSNSLKPRIKNGRPVSGMLLCDTPHISPDVCKSIKGAVRGQAMTGTHLLKLAKFCITLAMSVSVRDVRSAGYSCIRLNREGDMMAGHMKRRNREELMRLSARSSLPRSAHLALHEAKTSFSSRGNMLRQEHDFIIQCQGEQRDKKKKKNGSTQEFCKVRRQKHTENYWTIHRSERRKCWWNQLWNRLTSCWWYYQLYHWEKNSSIDECHVLMELFFFFT